MLKLSWLINFCLLCTIVLTACGDSRNGADGTDGLPADSSQAVPVVTHVIRKGDVADRIPATGTVFPLHDVTVSAQTAGAITQILVEVGDRVKKGAALMQIDPELKELALQQAEARLIEARAAFEKAKTDFTRNKKLHETQDISDYIFENVRLQMESAKAAYLTAEANVKMAKRQLRDARVESPVDGFIAARFVDLGSTVAPGAPIAKVVDISRVKIKIGVAEKDIVRVARGQPAGIKVDSFADESFEGAVSAVGPQADLSTRTFPVEIQVENPDYRLKAGMAAKVEIFAETTEDVTLIPKSALLERGGQTLIFVVKNGRAEKRLPKLGPESGDEIVLLQGAGAGEEVVILGQENLVDGTRVEVK